MSTRLREVAALLERGGPLDRGRVQRALDVHQRYLLEVHHVDEHRVTDAVRRAAPTARIEAPSLEDRARAEAFQHAARARLGRASRPPLEMSRELAALFRDEADRVDRHVAWEEEALHAHLAEWLARPVQRTLLAAIRRWDSTRVDAEIALVSWASQAHPSSD